MFTSFEEVNIFQNQVEIAKYRMIAGMSCWDLVNGLFHPYITRLFTSRFSRLFVNQLAITMATITSSRTL